MNTRLRTHWQGAAARMAPPWRLVQKKYQALAPRERRLVCGAVALAVCALSYAVLLEPAAKTISALQGQLPELRAQAATVTALSSQAIAQRRSSKRVQPTMPERHELAASLEAAGLSAAQWSFDVSASAPSTASLSITLQAAGATAVLRWIDTIAFDWGLTVKQLELTRATNAGGRPLPGLVNGSVTLNTLPPGSAAVGTPARPVIALTR